jgi:hypothetical protein
MSTTTGFERLLDVGADYVHELVRQALGVVAEVNNPTVAAPTDVQTFDILRRTISATGDPSAGIPDTYTTAGGLTGIAGSLILPGAWNDAQAMAGGPVLKATQRIVHLIDVPGTKVLQTDRIRYNDPIYGVQVFEIVTLMPNLATNITRCVIEYAREEGA